MWQYMLQCWWYYNISSPSIINPEKRIKVIQSFLFYVQNSLFWHCSRNLTSIFSWHRLWWYSRRSRWWCHGRYALLLLWALLLLLHHLTDDTVIDYSVALLCVAHLLSLEICHGIVRHKHKRVEFHGHRAWHNCAALSFVVSLASLCETRNVNAIWSIDVPNLFRRQATLPHGTSHGRTNCKRWKPWFMVCWIIIGRICFITQLHLLLLVCSGRNLGSCTEQERPVSPHNLQYS